MSQRIETAEWERLALEALSGLAGWRAAHPSATLAEIEAETDRRLAELRARMIQDTAQASRLAELGPEVARPSCPSCGCELVKNGRRGRQLTTRHEQAIRLERVHLVCPQCGAGFFPPR
jgi:YgiT-type zinc finger domain-containing protein